MTLRIQQTWEPGTPHPKHAHRIDMAMIAEAYFGVPFTPRSFEGKGFASRKINGVRVFNVAKTLADIEASAPEIAV